MFGRGKHSVPPALPFSPAAFADKSTPTACAVPLGADSSAKRPAQTPSPVGTSTTAAALIAHGFAAIALVTIGVTNADVTSNSDVDDGAADQGMDCT